MGSQRVGHDLVPEQQINSWRHEKTFCAFSCTLQPAYMTFPPRTVCLWKSRSNFSFLCICCKISTADSDVQPGWRPLCYAYIPIIFIEGQHVSGTSPVAGSYAFKAGSINWFWGCFRLASVFIFRKLTLWHKNWNPFVIPCLKHSQSLQRDHSLQRLLKVTVLIIQSCLTLRSHGHSPPGSSVQGILQARILE